MAAMSEILLVVPSSADAQPMKRNSSMILPPSMSELRVVLLGRNWSEKSSVGNFLLGDAVFKPEEESDCCQRGIAPLKEKQISVVNTPDLLFHSIYHNELSEHMETCANLSMPGPHVFLLVLQPEDFNEEQKQKLCRFLENFGKQSFHHALILVSEPREGSPEPTEKYRKHLPLKDMMKMCKYRYMWRHDLELPELLTRLGQIVRENNCDHVTCEMFERQAAEPEGLSMSPTMSEPAAPGLNLILCGRRGRMKTSAVKAILGQSASHPVSSECVKNQGKVCGRQVSMVELPALYGKSHQAVEESFRCICLSENAGVHAFILVVPAGPLTDEDKGELESIQSTFGSAVNDFVMILFSVKSKPVAEAVEFVRESRDIQGLCEQWGLRYVIIAVENQQQISDMLQTVENMGSRCYTKDLFTKAQMEKLVTLWGKLQEATQSLRALEEETKRKGAELRRKHKEIGALEKKKRELKGEVDQERKLKSKLEETIQKEREERRKEKEEETKKKDAELRRKLEEIGALEKKNSELKGEVLQERKLKSNLDKTIQKEREERRKEKEEENRKRNRDETQRQEMKRKLDLAEKTAASEREERENAEKKMETHRREMRRDREAWEKEWKDMWERRFQDQKENLQEEKSTRKELQDEYNRKRRKWMYIFFASVTVVGFILYCFIWFYIHK